MVKVPENQKLKKYFTVLQLTSHVLLFVFVFVCLFLGKCLLSGEIIIIYFEGVNTSQKCKSFITGKSFVSEVVP